MMNRSGVFEATNRPGVAPESVAGAVGELLALTDATSNSGLFAPAAGEGDCCALRTKTRTTVAAAAEHRFVRGAVTGDKGAPPFTSLSRIAAGAAIPDPSDSVAAV